MPPIERPCNGCTLCCILLGVSEIGKPACQRCPQQWDHGCSIYDRLPQQCREFKCQWNAGEDVVLTDADRPDQLGAMFDYQPPLMVCNVTHLAVLNYSRVREIIRGFLERDILVAVVHGVGANYTQKILKKGDM